ncbi:MFS general substrate transporter [Exidia glandulosa HHB12029]|uniref:MFS general substrate transporter n=1 Tax=Exidia glandulosa HHB12029 TaxID=1314781 RepID=A0A165NA21_EXIGL|nr:MFS general substrate transporter [Exidia glandulosa HHB12029]
MTPFDKIPHEYRIPDGGLQAWLTVLGVWFLSVATYGAVLSFGVLEDYYVRVYMTNKTSSQVAWIGSTQLFLLQACGLVSGKLFDEGAPLQIVGGLLYVFSIFMLSLVKENQFYQVFLAQGVGMGLGMGMTFIPATAVISHYFYRKRGVAMGISFTGSSVGGAVFPIMLNKLLHNPSWTFGNVIRLFGGIVAACLLVTNLLVRTRLPPRKLRTWEAPPPSVMVLFKDPPFIVASVATVITTFGIFFPIFYIQLMSALHGVDPNLSFYLITALNAASIPGRVIPGLLGDRLGPLNVLAACQFVCIGIILAMLGITGPAAAPPIVIALLYGFFYGGVIALTAPAAAQMSNGVHEVGLRIGFVYAFIGIASLFGAPLQGELLSDRFRWNRSIIFSSVLMAAGFVVFVVARFLMAKRKGTQFV